MCLNLFHQQQQNTHLCALPRLPRHCCSFVLLLRLSSYGVQRNVRNKTGCPDQCPFSTTRCPRVTGRSRKQSDRVKHRPAVCFYMASSGPSAKARIIFRLSQRGRKIPSGFGRIGRECVLVSPAYSRRVPRSLRSAWFGSDATELLVARVKTPC